MLLEQAREAGIRLVQVSTDEVYGDSRAGGTRPARTIRSGPRARTRRRRRAATCWCWPTCARTAVDALITRGSNTYGPNQYPEKVLPLFVTNALEGEPLPLYGDGRQVRDWLYVEDHCAGIELALREGAAGEVYNVGGGEEVENIAITRRILELTGRGRVARSARSPIAPATTAATRSTTAKLEGLGWRRSWTLEAGLPATVRWYEEHRGWWEPIKHSDDYRAYYRSQYATRLGA